MDSIGSADTLKEFCTFWVQDRYLGIDIQDVKEINAERHFVPLFHGPKEILGCVNIRGQIYLIIDLKRCIGSEKPQHIPETGRLILLKAHIGESLGILVDSVGDVVEVDPALIDENIGPSPDWSPAEQDCSISKIITRICRINGGSLQILDVRKLMSSLAQIKTAIPITH